MGGGYETAAGSQYSLGIGFVFVFNLVVGFGSLNLSYGVGQAGILFGFLFIAWICATAYASLLYVVEAQSTANAVLRLRRAGDRGEGGVSVHAEAEADGLGDGSAAETAEETPLPPRKLAEAAASAGEERPTSPKLFSLDERVEMAVMAELFMGKVGVVFFYAILVVYLYGDLAIYASAVPNELASITGGWWIFSDDSVYYAYLTLFVVLIGPLCFLNFQKTMVLQVITMVFRNAAIVTMIVLSIVWIATHGVHWGDVRWFSVTGAPKMFGVAIYSFMCHHSAPSLVTPIARKDRLKPMLLVDYMAILCVYASMAILAELAYAGARSTSCDDSYPCAIQPIYTQNFLDVDSYYGLAWKSLRPISLFLNLFPVLTLSTNFPLISVTLRNNLLNILYIFRLGGLRERLERYRWWPWVRQPTFSLLAIVPPFLIAYGTRNVSLLVSLTGSYAGLMIMYVIPALLLVFSRRTLRASLGDERARGAMRAHPFASRVLGHWVGVTILAIWSAVALAAVSASHVYDFVEWIRDE